MTATLDDMTAYELKEAIARVYDEHRVCRWEWEDALGRYLADDGWRYGGE